MADGCLVPTFDVNLFLKILYYTAQNIKGTLGSWFDSNLKPCIFGVYCMYLRLCVLLQAQILKVVLNQLNSELFELQHIYTDPEELELAVEIRLLLSSVNLLQGKVASR